MVFCLIGEFASGKTELSKRLQNHPSLQGVITTTSRPMRHNEKNGVDYFFVSDEEFIKMSANKEFVESNSFNNWYYGTPYSQFEGDAHKLIVINPSGFFKLRIQYGHDNVVGIVIHRNMRDKCIDYLKRDENADVYEMCRRIKADEEDFCIINTEDFKNVYHINNETNKFLDCMTEVESIIGGYLK